MSELGLDPAYIIHHTSSLAKDVCFKVCDHRGSSREQSSGKHRRKENIFAHKMLLAATSSVFKAHFYPGDDCEGEKVKLNCTESSDVFEPKYVFEINDISIKAFKLVVEFVYGSEIEWSITSPSCIFDIFVLASKYRIKNLKEVSEKEVRSFTRSDVIEIYGAINIAKIIIILDPVPLLDQVISACADSLFSTVRSVQELQTLARSFTNDPKECQAFCHLLAFKKNFRFEHSDSDQLSNSNEFNSSSKLVKCSQEQVENNSEKLECSFQQVDCTSAKWSPRQGFPKFQFSSPTKVLTPSDGYEPPMLNHHILKAFTFSSCPDVFQILKNQESFNALEQISPTVSVDEQDKNILVHLSTGSDTNNNRITTLSDVQMSGCSDSDLDSVNLLDDAESPSEECSPGLVSPEIRNFSCFLPPLIADPEFSTGTHNPADSLVESCVDVAEPLHGPSSNSGVASSVFGISDAPSVLDKTGGKILISPEKVEVSAGPKGCRRGTVRCKPFELLKKEERGLGSGAFHLEKTSLIGKEYNYVADTDEVEITKINLWLGKRKVAPVNDPVILKAEDERKVIKVDESSVRRQKQFRSLLAQLKAEDDREDRKDSPVRKQRGDGYHKGDGYHNWYGCGHSKCKAEMVNIYNWKRHMEKIHLMPDAKFDNTLLVNKLSIKKKPKMGGFKYQQFLPINKEKSSEEIDPFDFEIPVRKYPCSVFDCDFVGETRINLWLHTRHHAGGTKRQNYTSVEVDDFEMTAVGQVPVVASIQCITTMDQYLHSSLEELRWEDYKSSAPTFAFCDEGVLELSRANERLV
eukprot:GFUD01002693.1.p1 GENE.GFUD01002693.1~~GFUD01002693.1.p1  ORF type:complete len:828 (+),score=168.32 GFUD01002693.1:71-2485(+)